MHLPLEWERLSLRGRVSQQYFIHVPSFPRNWPRQSKITTSGIAPSSPSDLHYVKSNRPYSSPGSSSRLPIILDTRTPKLTLSPIFILQTNLHNFLILFSLQPSLPPSLRLCYSVGDGWTDCYSLQRVASSTRRSCGRTFVPSTLCVTLMDVSRIRASRLAANPLAALWTYWATNNAAHALFPEPSDTFQKACCIPNRPLSHLGIDKRRTKFRKSDVTSGHTATTTKTAETVFYHGPNMHRTPFVRPPPGLLPSSAYSITNCPCFPGQVSHQTF